VTTPLRVPILEWARRSATGRLHRLGWVDLTLDDGVRPFSLVSAGDDGDATFRSVPYGLFLPPPMVDAAIAAQERGEPTALEGLLLLFARPEWLVATRGLFWMPTGPLPALLAPLVEAYGADAQVHLRRPERLARLLAHLPRWYPHRGDAVAALRLLESAVDETPPVRVGEDRGADEVFACRSAAWWAARDGGHEALRVEGGVVRLAAAGRPEARTEDVTLTWSPDRPFPATLLRFLPAWATVRLLPERAA
jgi:hypothetical protein